MKRRHIGLCEKLAATLAQLLPQDQRDDLRARRVPSKQIVALFQFDHAVLHAFGGEDQWFNLTPLLVETHRAKTKKDISAIAKTKRINADPRWKNILAPKKRQRRVSRWPRRQWRSRSCQ